MDYGEHTDGPRVSVCGVEIWYVNLIEKTNDEYRLGNVGTY